MINNPRANSEDIVLYLFISDENKIEAYLYVLPDFLVVPNAQVKCGWLHQVWLKSKNEDFKILALIKEAKIDYDGFLLVNNNSVAEFINASKLTGFSLVNYQNGQQIQFYSTNTKQLKKNGTTAQKLSLPFQWLKDTSTNIISAPNRAYSKFENTKNNISSVDTIDFVDAFIEPFNQKNLFKRSVPEFNWISNNSWIDKDKTKKLQSKKYINYQYDDDQFVKHFVLKNEDNTFDAYFILRCVLGNMTIPYLFVKSSVVKTVADFIWQQAIKNKANSLTFYHKFIGDYVKNSNYPNLKFKAARKNIYATDKLSIYFSETVTFMDGDGDAAF